jgi:hypothetical protein
VLHRSLGNRPMCYTAYQANSSDWLQGRYAGMC